MKDVMDNEAKEHLTGLNKIKDKRTFEEKPGPCTKIAQAIIEESQKPKIDKGAAPWAGPALQNIITKLKAMPVPEEKLLQAAPAKKWTSNITSLQHTHKIKTQTPNRMGKPNFLEEKMVSDILSATSGSGKHTEFTTHMSKFPDYQYSTA